MKARELIAEVLAPPADAYTAYLVSREQRLARMLRVALNGIESVGTDCQVLEEEHRCAMNPRFTPETWCSGCKLVVALAAIEAECE